MRNLDGLAGFDESIVTMRGFDPGTIVAQGLPNACAIFEMINTYSVRAAGMRSMINLITLDNKGQLQFAVMG